MKKITILALCLICFACKQENKSPEVAATPQTPQELGKEIFEGKGNCTACHHIDDKHVGPSISEIAKVYQDKKGNLIQFLKGEAPAIVEPSQYMIMKTNLEVTKNFSDEELKAVEAYINNTLK